MTRVLALIGIVAILLFFRIPQRLNWNELRSFKGAEEVEKAAKPFTDGLNPKEESKPLPKDESSDPPQKPKDETWMRTGCQTETIRAGARLSKADYNRHLAASDLHTRSPLLEGSVKPFCIHQDTTKVFIPEWLINRQYRMKVTADGEDRVEQRS